MKRLVSSLACFCLLATVLGAASITFVGTESGKTVENWSNADPVFDPENPTQDLNVKTLDLNGDNRFGGAGYYQITPAEIEALNWSDSAGSGNNLGITASYPTLSSRPTFMTSDPQGGAGNYVNFSSYPNFTRPDGLSLVRQGSIAVSIPDQNEGTLPGDVFGKWCDAFSFTLSQSEVFRIGVVVDSVATADNAPDYVSIFNSSTGEVFCTNALTRDGTVDMVFFDIAGSANDVFTVRFWQSTGETSGPVGVALITFDKLPAPPTPTLVCTQSGDNISLSWEQNIPGWILESSTDLGSSDLWDPVPGVVNNSVTLSTSGVPKNFFRLRKDP